MRLYALLLIVFATAVCGQSSQPRFQTECATQGTPFVLRSREAQRCPCFLTAQLRSLYAESDLVVDVHALPEDEYSSWIKSWRDALERGVKLPDVPQDKAVSVRGIKLSPVDASTPFRYRWRSGSIIVDNPISYVLFSTISLKDTGVTRRACFQIHLLIESRPQKCPLRLAERTDFANRSATSNTIATYVVGGTRVDADDEFTPYNALISGRGNCTGSVISAKWILTAAHCTVDSLSIVRVGATGLSGGAVHRVQQFIRHPRFAGIASFTKQQIANDIALIQLRTPIQNPKPIQLNSLSNGPDPSTIVRATGYGKVTTAAASRGLRMVDVVVLSENECKRRFRLGGSYSIANGIEDDVHLCTGRDRECAQGGVCFGDSGGPIVARMPDNSLVQVGITSYGDQACATRESADVFVRVSSFTDWIQQVTGNSAKIVPWQSVGNTASGDSYGSPGGRTILGIPLWGLVVAIVGACLTIVAIALIILVRRSSSAPPEEPPLSVYHEQQVPPSEHSSLPEHYVQQPPPPPSSPPSAPPGVYSAAPQPSAPIYLPQSEISPPAEVSTTTTDVNPPIDQHGYLHNVQPSAPSAPDAAPWQELLLPPPQPPRAVPTIQNQDDSSARVVSYPGSTGVVILQTDDNNLGFRPQQQ